MKEFFRVPILMYHSIDDSGSVISIDPVSFKSQIRFLKASSFNVTSLDQVVANIRGGKPFPGKSVIITFDDGFKNVYTEAFPILQGYGFRAIVFLTTNYCGKLNNWPGQPDFITHQPLLSWSEIKEMSLHGIQFGAHTLNHPFLTQIPFKSAEKEILMSKKIIEDKLQQEVNYFAYPYGDFNSDILEIAKQFFNGACSTELATVQINSNPYALERIDLFYIKYSFIFKRLFTPYVSNYLKFRRLLRDLRRKV